MPLWLALVLTGVLFLLLVVLAVAVVWRRRTPSEKPRRKRRKDADADLATVVGGCRRFHRRLRQAFPGRRGRYRLPLYAVVGPERDAIAETVRRTGLARPLGASVAAGGLTWTAFDRGATVEVDPSVVFDNGRGDRWTGLIRALQRHRPERPLDGAIVVLPASRLRGADAPDTDALRAEAETLRNRLGALQNGLGMTLPVHVVVAEGEALPGFAELGTLLGSKHLGQPLGYTHAWGESEGYSGAHIDRAIGHVGERIDDLVLEALSAGADPSDRDSAFRLPLAVAELAAPLKSYFDSLFQGGQYARLAGLRGIYFAGSVRERDGDLARRPSFAAGALHERIFPEYTLAEPAHGFLAASNRDVRRAQAGLAVLVVLAGTGLVAADRMLAARVPQLEALTQTIGQDYRRVAAARGRGDIDGSLISADTIGFLRRAANLDGFFLRSLLVPSSWIGQLPRDLERLQQGAYVEILFKSIRASLDRKARRITSPDTSTRELARADADARPYPAVSRLSAVVDRYSTLTEHLDHYDSLRQNPDDAFALRELVAFLYDLDLPSGFDPDIERATNDRNELLLSQLTPRRFAEQARATFLQRLDGFTGDLVGRHEVLSNLRSAAEILRGETVVGEDRRLALTRLRTLRDTLARLQRLFDQGTYDWLLADGGRLNESFAELRERVAQHPLLGAKVEERMRRRVAKARRGLVGNLREVRVPKVGRLVSIDESGIGLTPEATAVLRRLQSFDLEDSGPVRADAFPDRLRRAVGGAEPARIPTSPGDGRHIHWRVPMLEAGRRVLERIDPSSVEVGESRAVTRTLRGLVRADKLDAVAAAVAQAARERPTDGGPGTPGAETRLRERVANFDRARKVLNDILFHLEDMGAYALHREITWLAGNEAVALLQRVDDLRQGSLLYGVDDAALQAWDGRPGLARALFGAESRRQLSALLAKRRSRMATLAEDFAGPPLAFVAEHADTFRPRDTVTVTRWQAVRDALNRYRNDAPASAVGRLERYVTGRLNAVSTDNCRLAHPRGSADGPTFFDARLRQISQAVLKRCRRLQQDRIHDAYAGLARAFNTNLAGRSPFVAPGKARSADAATPAAVARFIARFDRAMNKGVGEPRFWPDTPDVPRFLDRMDRAVAALRAGLKQDGESYDVRYELDPSFRIDRDSEDGGDHVLNWSFRSGDGRATLFDGDSTVSWQTGDPVGVALTWAKNAPTRPTDAAERSGYSRDGRTVTFNMAGRWSLFTLIGRYATGDDPPAGHRLRFTVPIAYTGSEPDGDTRLDGGRARLFMRLTLRANGEVVELPEFPARAPQPPESPTRANGADAAETGADTGAEPGTAMDASRERRVPRGGATRPERGGEDEQLRVHNGDRRPARKPVRMQRAAAMPDRMAVPAAPAVGDTAPSAASGAEGSANPSPRDDAGTDAPLFLSPSDWRRRQGGGDVLVQAGAFRDRARAADLKARLSHLKGAAIEPATVDGERFYRVRLGPFERPESVENVLDALAAAGVREPGMVVP
jgi:type VI secretion system protein ImpL